MPNPVITVTDENEIVLNNLCLIDFEDVEELIDNLDETRKRAYANLTDNERSALMHDIAKRLNVAIIADSISDCLIDTYDAAITRTLDTHDHVTVRRVSISKFARQFSDDYEILYTKKPCPTPNTPPTARDLKQGDALIRDQHPLVSALATYRQDILSSDREVIAFVRALRALDLLDIEPSRLHIIP